MPTSRGRPSRYNFPLNQLGHNTKAPDENERRVEADPGPKDRMKLLGPTSPVQLRSTADRVLLLRNPTAGSGTSAARLGRLIHELTVRGLRPEVITDLAELPNQVRTLTDQGRLRTVVAAGGDGTAEAVANLTTADTPLTIFPLGTENLLAKYLRLTADPVAIADAIEFGRVVKLDAGEIRIGDASTRIFLLMMGCGFDAEVIRRLHQVRDGHITHLSYAKPILEAIRTYDYPVVKVTCHEDPEGPAVQTITAHWVFLFNTPSYAVGLGICPDANPFDGALDLVTFHGGSLWQGLMHLGSVLLRRHRRRPSVQSLQARCVRITSDRPVPIQLDGDPWGVLPVDVRIMPERLTAVVPQEWTNPRAMG
jgi:diacylglycerol kinase (ATP)